MKIKRNGKLYVQLTDILSLKNLPRFLFDEIKAGEYEYDCFILIKNKEAIDYIEKQEQIIDYDIINSLSDLELCELMLRLYDQLDKLCKRYIDGSERYRKILLDNEEYNLKISNLKYKISTLKFYKSNHTDLIQCENYTNECICDLNGKCNDFIPTEILDKEKKLNFTKI